MLGIVKLPFCFSGQSRMVAGIPFNRMVISTFSPSGTVFSQSLFMSPTSIKDSWLKGFPSLFPK